MRSQQPKGTDIKGTYTHIKYDIYIHKYIKFKTNIYNFH